MVEKNNAFELETFKDKITIEGASFRYDADSETVLHDINLVIKKGELVAMVGPTGAGKSTLANLIPRFYDVTAGEVMIDALDPINVFSIFTGQVFLSLAICMAF